MTVSSDNDEVVYVGAGYLDNPEGNNNQDCVQCNSLKPLQVEVSIVLIHLRLLFRLMNIFINFCK